MNAKRAKAIRQTVRAMLKQQNMELPKVAYVVDEKRAKTIFVEADKEDGTKGVEKQQISPGQIYNAPKSVRGLYRAMKKNDKKAR